MDSSNEQFSRIYDQYIEKIYRFVYLKVDSQETAEDITSKVFLKGWEAYQKNDPPIQNIGAFLYQISRNMVVDYYKEKGRTKVVSAEFVAEMPEKGNGLYEKILLNSDVEAVKIAIKSVKQEYQDVLIWHYLGDMPTQQIAEILNKPTGTVSVMIHRGLKSLKNVMREQA